MKKSINALVGGFRVVDLFVPTRKAFDRLVQVGGWNDLYWDENNQIAVQFKYGIDGNNKYDFDVQEDTISLPKEYHSDSLAFERQEQLERERAAANRESRDRRTYAERLSAGFRMING